MIMMYVFILSALINILLHIRKWIKTDEEQFSAIVGWFLAISWCLIANFK